MKLVILIGAGISAESGIPTFRDASGLWTHFDLNYVCTASALRENPETELEFHNLLRKSIANAHPNAAHLTIADLEKEYDVTVITQNIDNLHERAGSTNVIHIYGDATKATSSTHRLNPDCIIDYPLDKPICVGDKSTDGSQLRPAVLLMDEYPFDLSLAEKACKSADVFLVIGTSFSIRSAASLASGVRIDVPRYMIEPSDSPSEGYIHIKKKATEGIVDFVNCLKQIDPNIRR